MDNRRSVDHLKVSDGGLPASVAAGEEGVGVTRSEEPGGRSKRFEVEERRERRSNPEVPGESAGCSNAVEYDELETKRCCCCCVEMERRREI